MTREYKITSMGWFHENLDDVVDKVNPSAPEGEGWRLLHTNILHSEECESVRFVWTWERQAEVEK